MDQHLQSLIHLELNKLPYPIVDEMADANQEKDEEWRTWTPVNSLVTDEEIQEMESRIGHPLPQSYHRFLKHKHFYDLQIDECSFCAHPAGIWRASLSEMIFNGYPREFLLDTGRIPFANWSDWGLLCFDTTIKCKNHDYPIVRWDHEVFDHFEAAYPNFEHMIQTLHAATHDNGTV
ncbi:MAG: SMI1/KNR4 family protein [Bacteroidia bacterium]|nr:SMI1/KNR4 family protein [Bacteroidia bacterium]